MPRTVGAICASSPALCEMVIDEINIENAKSVAELGPGTGVVTEHILRRIPSDANFFVVEVCQGMIDKFKKHYPDVKLYPNCASKLPEMIRKEGVDHLDTIVSGLPWASFPGSLQDSILDAIVETLKPGGTFTTYAYLQGLILPAAKRFRKKLEAHFSVVKKSPVVWKNVPPALVYRCRK